MMKKIIAVLVGILLLASLAACGEKPAPQEESSSVPAAPSIAITEVADAEIPAFTINVNGTEVNNEAMAAAKVWKANTYSVNSQGTEKEYEFIGYTVADVLAAAGIGEGYTKVEAVADDGYTIEYTPEQAAADTTLLAILRDGEEGKAGPWFAPCASEASGDYLKNVVEIKVDGAPAAAPAPTGDGALPEISDKTGKVEFAPYSFTVNGTAVNNETFAALNIYKITAVTVNSKGNTSEDTYTGYRLTDVLAACGVTDFASVTVVANDGYEGALDLALANSEYCLVAIEKNKEVGEDGTIWVAPCDQTSSKSFLKLVVEIKAE